MADDTWRSHAWGISTAAHAAVALLLVMALGADHEHRHAREAPPERMVWVEPAPPRAGVPHPPVPDAPPAPPVTAPLAPEAPAKPEVRAAPRLAKTGTAKPPAPVPAPRRGDAPRAEAAPGTPPAGVVGGAPDGSARGTAGGLGDAPLPLRAVATPPELVTRVVPEYPARARNLEIEGQVLLEVVLDRAGVPEADVRVLKSIAMLDAAAVAAVRQWRFRPARDAAGRAVRVVMEVPVRFELR